MVADPDIAKITVVGVGMRTHTGVAARMFAALAGPQIHVLMINTSEVHITAAVELARAREAARSLRQTFGLK